MAGKFRGKTTWDPFLIIFQITTVQLLSYSSFTVLILIISELFGDTPSILYIFDHSTMRLGNGKSVILVHLMNAAIGANLLKIFVERSKLCLDFTLTYYIIHFLLTWYYSRSIPDTFLWYFINVTCVCVMCIGAEYLCRREEMKSIPISSSI